MTAVTLQFSAADDPGSLAIRLYERGSFSHVDLVMPAGTLLGARDDVCQGVPAGVQIRPDGYANFSLTKRVSLDCTDAQAATFYGFLLGQVGKPYDETAIVAFALNRNWRTPDSWFCSELAASALETSLIFPYKLATTANKLTPGDLFLAASVLSNVNI